MIKTISDAKELIGSGSKEKSIIKGAEARLSEINRVLLAFMSRIKKKKILGDGKHKALIITKKPHPVVKDLGAFLEILERNPHFVELLDGTFSLSGQKLNALCEQEGVANPFLAIQVPSGKPSKYVSITKTTKDDRDG